MAKHHSDLRFCGCKSCSRGLHSGYGKFVAQYARRRFRRMVKLLCKEAVVNPDVSIPERVSVPYTD